MDKLRVRELVNRIESLAARRPERIRLMEICGTHTVSLFRSGVKHLLGDTLDLISGPGCPVCVTSQGYIDAACELADRKDVTICTYGDMVRVPGRTGSLEEHRAKGADVRVVYCPRDAVSLAAERPDQKIVFLAIGFETTAPATAAAILEARQKGVENFFVLSAHKTVIPAVAALLEGGVALDGLLCPGHVSIIIGANAYQVVVDRWGVPCAIAGFEPVGMLAGIASLVEQVIEDAPRVDNVYGVAVKPEGNRAAIELLDRVFAPADATWRAIGVIPGSGLDLRPEYERFDARAALDVAIGADYEPVGCRCGEVIQGKATPGECPLFGTGCTPMNPVGPCMVSSEGTCAAWYKYNRTTQKAT
jgi:hydrogenase expression/formation protein HypD